MGMFDGIGGLLGLGGETTTSTGSGGGTSTSTSSVNLPSYLEGPVQQLLSRANLLSTNALPTYGGPRIADFTPDQLQAFQMTRDRAGIAPGMAMQGFETANQGIQDLSQADLDRYMNPFQKAVTQQQLDELYRKSDQEMVGMRDQAQRVGAFGGSRLGVAENMQRRNTAQQGDQIVNAGASQAFNTALNQFNTQKGRELTGANTMGDLSKMYAGNTAADINSLLATGGQQQGLGQQNLSTAYNDFLEQRNAPYQQTSWLTDILAGAPSGRTTVGNSSSNTTGTQAQTQPGSNPLTSLLGLGLGIAGLF